MRLSAHSMTAAPPAPRRVAPLLLLLLCAAPTRLQCGAPAPASAPAPAPASAPAPAALQRRPANPMNITVVGLRPYNLSGVEDKDWADAAVSGHFAHAASASLTPLRAAAPAGRHLLLRRRHAAAEVRLPPHQQRHGLQQRRHPRPRPGLHADEAGGGRELWRGARLQRWLLVHKVPDVQPRHVRQVREHVPLHVPGPAEVRPHGPALEDQVRQAVAEHPAILRPRRRHAEIPSARDPAERRQPRRTLSERFRWP